MGVSIDLHVYVYSDLVGELEKIADKSDVPEGHTVDDFVERVLPEFGMVTGDKYVTLWNEYYSDSGYNSASELFRAVEMYFNAEDVFLSGYGYGEHANAEEVFERLEIPIPERDEEEYS